MNLMCTESGYNFEAQFAKKRNVIGEITFDKDVEKDGQ